MNRPTAEILREYGPFADAPSIHGVTYDGHRVWFAAGDALNTLDPDSGVAQRDTSNDEFVGRARRRHQRRRIECGEPALGRVELSDQQQPAQLQAVHVGEIRALAVCGQSRARAVQRRGRPVQIARRERDFRFGHDAARAGARRAQAKRTRGPAHQRAGACQIAELGHRDAAQGQRRRVVAQGDAPQRAERVTGGQRLRRGRDQRIHSNPATFVTPVLRIAAPNLAQ